MAKLTANVDGSVTTRADSRHRQMAGKRGLGLRIGPLVAISLVALSILWLVRQRIHFPQDTLSNIDLASTWPLFAGVAMVAAGVGGFVTLAWTSRRLAAFGKTPDGALSTSTLEAAVTDSADTDSQAAWRVMIELGGVGYWQSDAEGRYERVEPAAFQARSRIRELAGTARFPVPAAPGKHHPAVALRQRRVKLSDGTALLIREAARPRLNEQGHLIGYHGIIEDVGENREAEPITAMLTALATAPMSALLVRRQMHNAGAPQQAPLWMPVWANRTLNALSEYDSAELQQRMLGHWLIAAPSNAEAAARGESVGQADHGGPLLLRQLELRRDVRSKGLLIDRFGRRHEVGLTIAPLPGDDARGLALILIDHQGPELAKLQARTDHVDTLERAVSRKQRDIEWINHELEAFSHTVSHDLRQPVRQISGFTRILQEDHSELLDATGHDHLNRILNATHRMSEMIEALMEMHRISAHTIVRDPVDLSGLAEQAAAELRSANPDVDAEFVIETQVACRGDKTLLRMLIWNLFENAWKYSARRERRSIRLSTTVQDGQRVFEVADNGIGFDMKFADQIFSLFNRLHGSGEFRGNGVGLATVQRIIRRHKGRIWAESVPDQGTTFRFTLWEDES